MPHKPTHGGAREGAGRPATTASSTTRPVTFRLGAEDYDALERAARAAGLTIGQQAKAYVVNRTRM